MEKKQLRKIKIAMWAMNTRLRITRKGDYKFRGDSVPIEGATASVDNGNSRRRVTAGRFAVFGFLAFAGKKDMGKSYVTIRGTEGSELVFPVPQSREGEARRFVSRVNSANRSE